MRAVRPPSVPDGTARLRISVNAGLDDDAIDRFAAALARVFRESRAGLSVQRGLFVTGTDTGVGKTVVSAALMIRLRAAVPVRYWKPIQTGIEEDDDTATVAALARCTADEL